MATFDRSMLRASESDRQQAAATLEGLFAEGYINLSEFEHRTSAAYAAKTRGDLDELFKDVPLGAMPSKQLAFIAGTQLATMDVPTQLEYARRGRRTRLGIFSLATIADLALVGATGHDLLIYIIPALAVMLTLLRVGPASWYVKPPTLGQRAAARVNQVVDSAPVWRAQKSTY